MLDLNAIPEKIKDDLKSRGHSDEQIAKMTPELAFDEYCNWNGLVGWGGILWMAAKKLKGASKIVDQD